MPTQTGPSQPGWYGDPSNPAARRYWDGRAWTEHVASPRAPRPGAESWRYAGPTPMITHRLVVAGWAAAFLLPPIGMAIGFRLAGTYERRHGIAMILVSAIALVVVAVAVLG